MNTSAGSGPRPQEESSSQAVASRIQSLATAAQHLGHQAAEAKTASDTASINCPARQGAVHGKGTVHGEAGCKLLHNTYILKHKCALHAQNAAY